MNYSSKFLIKLANLLCACFVALLFLNSCSDDDEITAGDGDISWTTDNLRISESTSGFVVGVKIGSLEHPGGSVVIEITGLEYGEDYTTNTGSSRFNLDFSENKTSTLFEFSAVDDFFIEEDKEFQISIVEVEGGLPIGDIDTINGVLIDDDDTTVALVDFDDLDATANENASDTTQIDIAFNQPSTEGGTITIDKGEGDAVLGVDYTIEGVSEFPFEIEVDQYSVGSKIVIQPIDNDLLDDNRSITFEITEVEGGLKLGEQLTTELTIINNELPPLVSFSVDSIGIAEEVEEITQIILEFESPIPGDGTVHFDVSSELAEYGTDYTINDVEEVPFSIDVAGGAESIVLEIQPIDNSRFSGDKDVTISISEVTENLLLGEQSTTKFTIVNDDEAQNPLVNFAMADMELAEATGTTPVTLKFDQPTDSEGTVTIAFSGTATAGEDYMVDGLMMNELTLTIPVNSEEFSFDLTVTDDDETETNETIQLDITAVTGGLTLGATTNTQTLTLLDDDADPYLNLYFSEYFDGTGARNDYIELYNASNTTLDLSRYLMRNSNFRVKGWQSPRDLILPEGTMLAPGEVFIISRDEADDDIKAVADYLITSENATNGNTQASILNYDGRDAIGLFYASDVDTWNANKMDPAVYDVHLDMIGFLDNPDGNTVWTVAGVEDAAREHTLVRKPGIEQGNNDWESAAGTDAASSEWIVREADYKGSLGVREE